MGIFTILFKFRAVILLISCVFCFHNNEISRPSFYANRFKDCSEILELEIFRIEDNSIWRLILSSETEVPKQQQSHPKYNDLQSHPMIYHVRKLRTKRSKIIQNHLNLPYSHPQYVQELSSETKILVTNSLVLINR